MNINIFIISLSIFLAFSANTCKKENPVKPNIVFILGDDHTSQAWGVYGGVLEDHVINASIKRLAENGVILENAFTTNAICRPTRTSFLTGTYSHINGVYGLDEPFHPDSTNIAKLFQNAGYQTAIFGKWELHYEPSGFDHYMIVPFKTMYNDPKFKTRENWVDGEEGGIVHQGYSTDLITDYSINWIEDRDKSKPFLLFTHFIANHEPYGYPERHKNLFKDMDLPSPETLFEWGTEESGKVHDGWPLEILGQRFVNDTVGFYQEDKPFSIEGLNREEARMKIYQKYVKDFLRCSAANDDNIGKMLDYLKEAGLLDNTIIIYTSDQGCFLGEHGYFDKRFIYEQSMRIPFVIQYPRELEGNRRIDDIILDIDIPALLLDFAGIHAPAPMQGRSFRENLLGTTPSDWRQAMYYRYWINQPERPAHFGIRDERYKLAFFYGQSRTSFTRDIMPYEPGWEFYDLEKDPHEKRNAINDPAYKSTIDSLKNEIIQLRKELGGDMEGNPMIAAIIEKYWDQY